MPLSFLVLGCTSSGKSTFVLQLKHLLESGARAPLHALHTSSTSGVSPHSLRVGGVDISLKEVGGPMRATWQTYIKQAKIIIFIIDSTQINQLSIVQYELLKLCDHLNSCADVRLLLLLNKVECAGALTRIHIDALLNMDQIIATTTTDAHNMQQPAHHSHSNTRASIDPPTVMTAAPPCDECSSHANSVLPPPSLHTPTPSSRIQVFEICARSGAGVGEVLECISQICKTEQKQQEREHSNKLNMHKDKS